MNPSLNAHRFSPERALELGRQTLSIEAAAVSALQGRLNGDFSRAVELILTYPQKHDVNVTGSALGPFKAGTFKHLPPTLLLQYHFLPTGKIRPYVGAGGNLTLISKVDLNVPGVGALDLENSSVGGAAQVGADVQLAPGFFLNLDAKKVMIRSDVLSGGSKVSAVKVDPWLLSVGIGRRF